MLVWFVSSLHFARRGSKITSLVNHTAGRLHLHKFWFSSLKTELAESIIEEVAVVMEMRLKDG